MRIHLIAIGGAAMHNLALELSFRGHQVSGSDDAIYEPAKSRLKKAGLLPQKIGWNTENINSHIELVILGMHAKKGNEELEKALELGIQIVSYPEFIAHFARNQKRIVIAGSHGKTTITSMILHVFKKTNQSFNYLVGAQIEGFDRMVKLDENAKYFVIEGDEYLSSCLDSQSKFHWYKPQFAVISGVSWDHINVFPTYQSYLDTFSQFIKQMPQGAHLAYCSNDIELIKLINNSENENISKIAYDAFQYQIHDHNIVVRHTNKNFPMKIIGRHNFENMKAAATICKLCGIDIPSFLTAMQDFAGAAKRMEFIVRSQNFIGIKDFAHSPSKVLATVNAVKETFKNKKLVAILELHTFSSLNKSFLKEYKNCLNAADCALVYTDMSVFEAKNRTPFTKEDVQIGFNNDKIKHSLSFDSLKIFAEENITNNSILLVMSSGNFGGSDIGSFIESYYQRLE